MGERFWTDVEPGEYSISDYAVSKKLIHLLRHGKIQFFLGKDMTGRKSAERITRNKTAWDHLVTHKKRNPQGSANKSAKSGVRPSVPVQASSGEDNREAAKALPQEMANILIHLRCHAKCADRRKTGGTSRHLPAAREVTKLHAS